MSKNRRNRNNVADFPGNRPSNPQPQSQPQQQQQQAEQWQIGAQNILMVLRSDDIKLNFRTREAAEGGVQVMLNTIQEQKKAIAALEKKINDLENEDDEEDTSPGN